MMKRIDPFVLTEKEQIESSLAEWAFDSHNWVEYQQGYYRCDWCELVHTSVQGISKDFPLCKENYCIEKLLQKNS